MRIDALAKGIKRALTDQAIESVGSEGSTILAQPESVCRFSVKQVGTVVLNIPIDTTRAPVWEDGQMEATGLCLLRRDVDAPGRAILDNGSANLLSCAIGEAERVSSKKTDD